MKTRRLEVRRTQKEDADFSLSIWLDEEMGQFLLDPPREKAGSVYLEWKETVEIYEGCYYFTAILKDSGAYIGTCSAIPNKEKTVWDIGYAIHKHYWKQGFGTEMVVALITFCQKNGGKRIVATVAKENVASNMLLRKLGFQMISQGSFQKCHTDIIYDDYTYALDM